MLELRAQVGGAGVAQAVGNLVQCQFIVSQQLFGALYFLGDGISFDGAACFFGEGFAQRAVILVQKLGKVVGKIGGGSRFAVVDQPDDGILDLLHQAGTRCLQQFEAFCLQGLAETDAEGIVYLFPDHGYAQFHGQRVQAKSREAICHSPDAAGTNHVLDVEGSGHRQNPFSAKVRRKFGTPIFSGRFLLKRTSREPGYPPGGSGQFQKSALPMCLRTTSVPPREPIPSVPLHA